jgi:hypothetical protein
MKAFASPLPLLRLRLVPFAAVAMALAFAFAPRCASAQPGMPGGANYTDDMPSVAKVESVIQGTDPIDTAARQVTVFDYLVTYIDRVHTNRDVRGPFTTGEGTLMGLYRGASAQITQELTKSHTAAEVQRFNQLEGKYSFDDAFMRAWPKQLIGSQASAAVQNANSGLNASAQRMYNQQMQDLQQAQQAQAQQQTAMVNGERTPMSNDPTAVATRRCLELGGTTGGCVGGSFVGGLMGMITGGQGIESLTGPGPAGVVLSGSYSGSQGGAYVSFLGDMGSIGNCGKLVPEDSKYTIKKAPGSLTVTLPVSPSPVTLTMRPDGSLIGPGPITLNGRIITGYEVVTTTRNPASNCAPNCVTTTRTPIYAAATDRCTVGALPAPAPPPPAAADGSGAPPMGGMLGGVMDTLMGVMTETTVVDKRSMNSLPGLRMEGKYTSNGLQLDFAGDAVTLDCGQAHVKSPYTVENAANALIVHVQNPGGPFDLVVSSDKMLRGSGSTTVNGRLVSGMNGTDITYTPRSETCQVGSYAPQTGSGSTTAVAANASPAPAPAAASVPVATAIPANTASTNAIGAAMTLAITSSFPIAKNPLAGAVVKLMTDRFDNVLRTAGAPVPNGTTPGQALAAYVNNCPPPAGCPAAAQKMKPYFVGTATFDNNGAATISAAVPPGNYYVICSARGTTGGLVWDLPVTLKAGQNNSISLTATNAELVK